MTAITEPPTGAQFELRRGRQRLVVTEIGAGVRSWTIGGRELRSVPLDPATLADTDAVIVLTAHPQIDVHAIVAAAPLVFDARGATVGIDEPHVERL